MAAFTDAEFDARAVYLRLTLESARSEGRTEVDVRDLADLVPDLGPLPFGLIVSYLGRNGFSVAYGMIYPGGRRGKLYDFPCNIPRGEFESRGAEVGIYLVLDPRVVTGT